jgi:hypothetical protein
MSEYSFETLWAIFAIASILILGWAGKASGKGLTGAWIDSRKRYSLNRFQLIMWSVMILSAFAALFVTGGLEIPEVNPQLLGLIGISAGSAVTAAAVKSNKDIQARQVNAAIKAAEDAEGHAKETLAQANRELTEAMQRQTSADFAAAEAKVGRARELADQAKAKTIQAKLQVPRIKKADKPKLVQMLLEEEGEPPVTVVSVTKFQNLILTLVAGVALLVMVAKANSLNFELTEQFLWLLGISHTTYVGGKIPNKAPDGPE